MNKIDQFVILFLAICTLVFGATTVEAKPRAKQSPPTIEYPININKADEKALAALPGISKNRAHTIVAYREEHGKFKTVDDLANVRGISHRYVEKNKQYLKVK